MSSKKNPKKNPQPKQAVQSKPQNQAKPEKEASGSKKSTKIIIAAAVAILLAAVVIVAVFVIKPMIDGSDEPSTSNSDVTQTPNEGENYVYVDYKGTRMAKELADILNQAELDNAAAVKEYGAALTVGDRKISKSQFVMYYYEEYYAQVVEVYYSIEKRGNNMTGYDLYTLPDEQQYHAEDYTWAEDFTVKAIEKMQDMYSTFDEAIKNGLTMTEPEIFNLIQTYKRIEGYTIGKDLTEDDFVASVYGKGNTYATFAAYEIIRAYATKYEQMVIDEYYNSYSEEEIDRKRLEDENKYKIVKARVYPIESEYDPAELSRVSTEAEFLEFAQNNYPGEKYDAEVQTQQFYSNYNFIASTYGEETAEWLFSEDRVPGEISVVKGMLYEYLVYIEQLPVYGTSRNVITYEFPFDGSESSEDIQARYNEVKDMFDDWSAQNMTEDEFRTASFDTGYGFEGAIRSGDYYYQINNWVFDRSRKNGDMEFFADDSGLYIVYYCGNNPEDFDWKVRIRNDMCTEQYLAEHKALVEKDYKAKRDNKVINQAYKTANVLIANDINKNKKNNAQG